MLIKYKLYQILVWYVYIYIYCADYYCQYSGHLVLSGIFMKEEHSIATAPAKHVTIIIALLVPKRPITGPEIMKARISPVKLAMLRTEQALPSIVVGWSLHSLRNSMPFSCMLKKFMTVCIVVWLDIIIIIQQHWIFIVGSGIDIINTTMHTQGQLLP